MPQYDLSKPYIGYRSAGRRPEANNDRTASANAPLSALRGWAAGTAGLPGDIEGLARAGISQLPPQLLTAFPALRAFGIGSRADPTPQLPTTEFYNEYLPGANLNQTPTGKAFTSAGNLLGGTGSTTLARYGIKSAKATAKAIAEAAPGPASGSRAAQLGVIKLPGGNFLKGEVEDAVKPMKSQPPAISGEIIDDIAGTQLFDDYRKFYDAGNETVGLRQWTEENHPDIYKQLIGKQGAALNNFIDKKIAPYVKNEMATPDDPLRAMAEKYDVDKPVKLAEVQARIDAFAAKMEQEAKERGVPVEMLTSMRQQMIGLEKEKALVEAREGLHFTPDEQRYEYTPTVNNREKAGMPIGGMGRSPLARSWENVTDSAFNIDTAGKWLNYKGKYPETALTLNSENPWLAKVPPETKLYSTKGTLIDRTGFDHLVDELRNATIAHGKQKELDSWLKLAKTPEEVAAARQAFVPSLPANLHIDPADLGKLTMPQAVDLVADINAWRATQKIEANQLLANNAATQVVKEYPEQGLKWVELRAPKDAKKETKAALTDSDKDNIRAEAEEEAWALKDDGDTREIEDIYNDVYARIEADFSPSYQYDSVKVLEDALKYEGDTMQHCVGGYCQDVVEGKSRIYSLRDTKGQPRVTIEVETTNHLDFNKWWDQQTPQKRLEIDQRAAGNGLQAKLKARIESPEYLADMADLPPSITQIKGFKNKKPADEYLPMVQDFVKSGNWSGVGDLGNTGLIDIQDPHSVLRALGKVSLERNIEQAIQNFNAAVKTAPDAQRYMNINELRDFLGDVAKPEGFAQGGAVHMDEGGAAFGVFPQMKPRRAQQDRTAAANAPLSAVRGWLAGTAGLPGDIEGLARAGISQLPPQLLTAFPALRAFGIGSRADPTPQMPTTEFYNEYLPGAQLNATPIGKAFTTAGNLLGGTGSTTLARYGIKSAKATAKALGPTAVRIGEDYLERQGLMPGVIKLPGGNFLSGSVEESVRPMKRGTPSIAFSQEEADDLIARGFVRDKSGGEGYYLPPDPVNNFIDKKIAPYIRNEMATPDDPLRAMAEKYAVDKPVKLAEVQGRIDAFAAKMEQTARERGVPVEMLTSMRQQMIGLEKEKALLEAREALHAEIAPTTHDMGRIRKELGFPEEGMGVSPQAKAWESRSDSFINTVKASDMTDAHYQGVQIKNPWLLKVPPETNVYSLYNGLNSDLGFRHLVDELRNAINPASGLPKNLLIDPADLGKLTMPQAVDRVADINAWRATQKIEANQAIANNAATFLHKEYPTIPGTDESNKLGLRWMQIRHDPSLDILPKSLKGKQEGDEYVIRNSKGQVMVSHDNYAYAFDDLKYNFPEYFKNDPLKKALKYEGDTMAHSVGGYATRGGYGAGGIDAILKGEASIYSLRDAKGQPQVTIETRPGYTIFDTGKPEGRPGPERIIQIKGKSNRKPADEYLPFVQDFVKSGNWSDVGDLQNAGLHDARAAGKAIEGRPAFMTDEELEAFKAEFAPKPEGMAKGGFVSNHFDPIKIKQIIAGLDDEYDPENIQQIIAQRESAYA